MLTGSTGFLGSHLLDSLLANNYQVVILKRTTSSTSRIKKYLDRVSYYDIDITPIEDAFIKHKVDVVIHLACSYGRGAQTDVEIIDTNLILGIRLLNCATASGVNLFVNLDTLLPRNLGKYALSKSFFRDWILQKSDSIKVANLKVEHMYGPNDGLEKFIPFVIKNLKEKVASIDLTSGLQKRDFIYIDDVVDAINCVIKKADQLCNINEFEIGTGVSIEVRKMLTKLISEFEQNNGTIQTILNYNALNYRENEPMEIIARIAKIKALGWSLKINLKNGLKKTLYNEKD